ncbi:MAG: hypothetical protein U0270_03420 [Labilithrix sp.]
MLRLLRIGALGLALALVPTSLALADETAPAPAVISESLMSGLAQHAQKLEDMKARGVFTFSGKMEMLDDNNKPTEVREMTMRSTPTGAPRDRVVKVMKYTEDGKDKTAEAQAKADARRAKHKIAKNEKLGNDLKLPFLASEQSRYIFSVAERDKTDPTHVRINFNPKTPAEDAIKGSAWVDETSKEVLSVGFSLSKNPAFIDHVDVTIVFGLPTQLGRAPSAISFDGRGGFLFIRKHYRGSATITDPGVAF